METRWAANDANKSLISRQCHLPFYAFRLHVCETKEETGWAGLQDKRRKKPLQLFFRCCKVNFPAFVPPSLTPMLSVFPRSSFHFSLHPDTEKSVVRSRPTSARHNSTLLRHNEVLESISAVSFLLLTRRGLRLVEG